MKWQDLAKEKPKRRDRVEIRCPLCDKKTMANRGRTVQTCDHCARSFRNPDCEMCGRFSLVQRTLHCPRCSFEVSVHLCGLHMDHPEPVTHKCKPH